MDETPVDSSLPWEYSLAVIFGILGVILCFALILIAVIYYLIRYKKGGKLGELIDRFLPSLFPSRDILDDTNVLVETDGAFEGNYNDDELRDDHFSIDSDDEEESK